MRNRNGIEIGQAVPDQFNVKKSKEIERENPGMSEEVIEK
jgi:hypothetical protein